MQIQCVTIHNYYIASRGNNYGKRIEDADGASRFYRSDFGAFGSIVKCSCRSPFAELLAYFITDVIQNRVYIGTMITN